MTKHGVFLLKKLNLNKIFKFTTLILLVLIAFTGCKSAPKGSPVDAIELLDNDSAFYIAIPKAADPEFIQRIIQTNVKNISESDAKLITDHVNKVYCGLTRSKNKTEIQSSIEADVPRKYLPKVLSKKNGWNERKLSVDDSKTEYTIYNNSSLDLTFPSDNICCIGRDVEEMLVKYDSISNMLDKVDGQYYSDLDDELLSYLKGAEEEIRFYANKPQSFLTILTGAQLDLKLIDVKGAFVVDPKHQNQYLLDIDFNFKNATFMKAGRALLTLAFGLTNSQSIVYNESGLRITGIKLDKKQLYKLLVL